MRSTGLEGRSVIVTDGGSGTGRAALEFAEEGAKVLIADLDKDGATQVVKTIAYAGGTARAVVGDLSDPRVVERVVSTAVEAFGGVDVLVNNAGVTDRMSALADTDDVEWERILRVDLTAPFLLKVADAEKQAAAIGFLASDAASDINGAVLPVDHGWSAV